MHHTLNLRLNVAPQRMRGSRPLRHIPNEIYLEIFDTLRPGPYSSISVQEHMVILSSLMLVCHFFRDACAPHRYSSLQIKGSQKRHVDFCNAIRKSPRLVPDKISAHVRELHFSEWMAPTDESKWVVKGLLKVYSTTIDKFLNVTLICLVDVLIDSPFFNAVAEMQRLEEVAFTRCTFVPLAGKQPTKTMEATTRAPWTKLKFTDNEQFETYLPRIKTLTPQSSLISFKTTHSDVARTLLKGVDPLDNLKMLSIPYDNIDNAYISDILSRAKNIESLAFPLTSDPDMLAKSRPPKKAQPLCLPSSTLPRLKTLQCPSWLVKDLVVGRPTVTELDVSGVLLVVGRFFPKFDEQKFATPDILGALRGSTTRICSLAVGLDALELKNKGTETCVGDLNGLKSLRLYVSGSWNFSVSQ